MPDSHQTQQPSHRAFTIIRHEGQDDYWLDIGPVFEHEDGGGFDIMVQFYPIHGQIVCRKVDDPSASTRRKNISS